VRRRAGDPRALAGGRHARAETDHGSRLAPPSRRSGSPGRRFQRPLALAWERTRSSRDHARDGARMLARRPMRACRRVRAGRLHLGGSMRPLASERTLGCVAKRKPASAVSGERSDRHLWAGASRPTGPELGAATDADSAQSETATDGFEMRVTRAKRVSPTPLGAIAPKERGGQARPRVVVRTGTLRLYLPPRPCSPSIGQPGAQVSRLRSRAQ
jgi:hypothetical protein